MKLVALVHGLDNVCYRYRVQPFENRLRERGWEVSLSFFSGGWFGRLPRLAPIRQADVVLLQRRLLRVGEVRLLRRAARRLVYDFDDAIFYRSSNSPKSPYNRRRENRFAAIVRAADSVIAGNDFLAKTAGRFTDPAKIWRIPTCVESEAYLPARHREHSNPVQLVWIGSSSTAKNLKYLCPHLEAVVTAVPHTELKVICDVFPDHLPIAVQRCVWSADREATELADADVGIGWLPDHPWSEGKCSLKVVQYMAAGLPVIANSVGVHREMIVHGETGFLADTPDEWARAVRTLAEDANLRRAMGEEGRKRVCLHYSAQRWTDQFAAIMENAQASQPN